MKRHLFSLAILILCSAQFIQGQNCSLVNPSVTVENTQTIGNTCLVTFQLACDIKVNSGEKYLYLHFWKVSDYPGHVYNTSSAPTNLDGLGNSVFNLGINNSGVAPAFLPSYAPDNTVSLQNTINNPLITIQKTTSTTAGADRFIISHIQISVPNAACGNSLVFKGDFWSTNSSSANAVHCAATNFAVGIIDPTVSGSCQPAVVPTYSFIISTVLPSIDVYYDVYLDNGNNIFDPANDQLLSSRTLANAVTITPTSPYNSGPQNYPSVQDAYTKKIFVSATQVGQIFSMNGSFLACALAAVAVNLKDFNAVKTKAGASLSWTTVTEQDNTGFEIERQVGNNFEPVGFVPSKAPGGNSNAELHYSFIDPIMANNKWIYYRLKQTDIQGRIHYSEAKKVFFERSGDGFMILPNPTFNNKTNIVVPAEMSKVDVILSDMQGRTVRNITGSSAKNIVLTDLKPGFYIVRLIDKLTNAAYSEKLIVQ